MGCDPGLTPNRGSIGSIEMAFECSWQSYSAAAVGLEASERSLSVMVSYNRSVRDRTVLNLPWLNPIKG